MRPADHGGALRAGVGALSGDLEVVSRQFGRNLAEARGWVEMSQVQLAERVSSGRPMWLAGSLESVVRDWITS